MSAELLPCPFCDDPMEAFVATPEGCARGKELFWVVCDHCGAMGGTGNSVDGAIAAWNTRATQPQAPQGAVTGWRPIETAPKDGTLFLCWVDAVRYGEDEDGNFKEADASSADFCVWVSRPETPDGGYFDPCAGPWGDAGGPTHWQPLPAAPETPEGKK